MIAHGAEYMLRRVDFNMMIGVSLCHVCQPWQLINANTFVKRVASFFNFEAPVLAPALV